MAAHTAIAAAPRRELTTIYTAASPLRAPVKLIGATIHDAWAARELAWRLLVRNLSARYRQTLLGYGWAILPPLLTSVVFVLLHQAGYFTVEKTAVPYALFVLTGMTFWQLFADALQAPLRMVSQSAAMLTKVNFPREALILAAAGEVLYASAVRLALLVGAVFWFQLPSNSLLVFVPAGLIALLVLGLALGLLLTPLALLYQDVSQGLPFIVSLWMFATPVLYPAGRGRSGEWWMTLNPVMPLLDTTRAWLFGTSAEWLLAALWIFAFAASLLLIGLLFYRLALPVLIERMNG